MVSVGMNESSLKCATALHFNGEKKPWDSERCTERADLSPAESLYVHYADLSPELYKKYLDDSKIVSKI